jgi:uncharacterized protein (DUF2236 family)
MNYYVGEGSIVRRIWGKSDTVLLIFAGASAEFALNKSVDWLYYTGRLPADPIGRLFSTVRYAQEIIFSEEASALAAIDRITAIHKGVEENRGARIPDTAYLDVLFMLIDYSIRAFELIERRLKEDEKEEIFQVFYRFGTRMGLRGLPDSYSDWELMRAEYLAENLVYSRFTADLYRQYLRSLGSFRYCILLQAQALLAPVRVGQLIGLPSLPILAVLAPVYKASRFLRMDRWLKALLLPAKYKAEIAGLDTAKMMMHGLMGRRGAMGGS